MKLINLLSILFILMIVIQPVSAENKILTQPLQNHSFSFLDSSYVIQYTMHTDVIADPSKGRKTIFTVFPTAGECLVTTLESYTGTDNSLAHSGSVYSADLRGTGFLGDSIDIWASQNLYSNDNFAFDVDSDPYFCFQILFVFGYTDGDNLVSNKLLIKVYEGEAIPVTNTPTEDNGALSSFISFNFLSLLIVFPLLVLLRRKQLCN